jgi:hypothetical protein
MESQSIAIGINCSLVGDRPNRPYQFEKGVPFNLVTSCGIPVQAEFIIKPRRLGSHSSPRFGKFRPFLGENTTLVRFFAAGEQVDDADEAMEGCDTQELEDDYLSDDPENEDADDGDNADDASADDDRPFEPGWIAGLSSAIGRVDPFTQGCFFEVVGGVYRLQVVLNHFFQHTSEQFERFPLMVGEGEIKIGFGESAGEAYITLDIDGHFGAVAWFDAKRMVESGCALPSTDLAHGSGILLELLDARDRSSDCLRFLMLSNEAMRALHRLLARSMAVQPLQLEMPRPASGVCVDYNSIEIMLENGWEERAGDSPFIDAYVSEEMVIRLLECNVT